jgi:hypothetical protein
MGGIGTTPHTVSIYLNGRQVHCSGTLISNHLQIFCDLVILMYLKKKIRRNIRLIGINILIYYNDKVIMLIGQENIPLHR